jgi:hypothetical protein
MASRVLKIDPEKKEEKGAASEPLSGSAQPTVSDNVEEEETGTAALAYLFWQKRGCPIGSDQEDWFRAEERLKNRGW